MKVQTQGSKIATTIHVPVDVWRKLRELAHQRGLEGRGRSSASAVIADLVEKAAAQRRRRAA